MVRGTWFRHWSVEDEQARAKVYFVLLESAGYIREDFWFCKDEFDSSNANSMSKLDCSIRRIRTRGETTSADDGEDQKWIKEGIEGVDADSVSWLKARGV